MKLLAIVFALGFFALAISALMAIYDAAQMSRRDRIRRRNIERRFQQEEAARIARQAIRRARGR